MNCQEKRYLSTWSYLSNCSQETWCKMFRSLYEIKRYIQLLIVFWDIRLCQILKGTVVLALYEKKAAQLYFHTFIYIRKSGWNFGGMKWFHRLVSSQLLAYKGEWSPEWNQSWTLFMCKESMLCTGSLYRASVLIPTEFASWDFSIQILWGVDQYTSSKLSTKMSKTLTSSTQPQLKSRGNVIDWTSSLITFTFYCLSTNSI